MPPCWLRAALAAIHVIRHPLLLAPALGIRSAASLPLGTSRIIPATLPKIRRPAHLPLLGAAHTAHLPQIEHYAARCCWQLNERILREALVAGVKFVIGLTKLTSLQRLVVHIVVEGRHFSAAEEMALLRSGARRRVFGAELAKNQVF